MAACRSWCVAAAIGLTAGLWGGVAPASGQGALGASGLSPLRGTHSVVPFEHVDPFSGNLLLTFTDLELPGNAGLNLRVQRVYNSKIHRDYHDTPNHFKPRRWVGLGWSLHFGRVLHASTPGQRAIEMGDGSGHALYNALPGDPDNTFGNLVTAELWRYNASTHTLRLPNGLIYVFGHIGAVDADEGQVRYVTEIRDQYNNKLQFQYFASNQGPTDGVKQITQIIDSQTRVVTFTVTPLVYGYALATMQYAGRTWTYTHIEPSGHPTQVWLTGTSGPVAGTSWTFTYRTTLPGPELLTVAGPLGGEVRYTYGDINTHVWDYDTTLSTRGVFSRTIGLTPGASNGTWSFAYRTGPYENISVVTGPTRRETYRYRGIGLHQGGGMAEFAPWLVGAIDRQTVEDLSSNVLQESLTTWGWSLPVSDDNVEPLPSGVWGAPEVRKAIVLQTTLTQGPRIWHSVFTYDDTLPYRYNDYFRPKQVVSWYHPLPARARTTTQTFWYGTGSTPYIRDRVASTTVSVGSQSLVSSATYQAATGFPTQQTVRGVSTSFTRTTQGNVSTVTDAAGKTTTFTYNYGVVATIDAPNAGLTTGADVTRTISADGTVAVETVGPLNGGLTTTFKYDDLMRVTRVTPPGDAEFTEFSYAAAAGGYSQQKRGGTHVRTYVDGFGRPIRTQDAHGVQTRQEYDAIGRVTRSYLPYTTGTGTRSVAYEYDALDRPTRQVAADGTSQTLYTYNGTETWITDPEGRKTVYHYYSDSGPGGGQLEMVRDAANQETTYTYDAAGALTATAGPVSGIRTWTYNSAGRLISETHPESGTTTYTWNPVGTLASVTTPLSETLTYTYDNAHRLVGRDAPGTSYDLSVTYDALGRVSQRTFGGVTTATQFDTAGRPSQRADTVDGITFGSTYTYDNLDRLITLKYPSWHTATYEYAAAGRLTAVKWLGAPYATFTYDAETGNLTSYTTGPVKHAITYDTRDRVDLLSAGPVTAPNTLSLDYGYDRASLVTTIGDARPGHSQTFGYDPLGRLTSAQGVYGAITWTYAANGDRLTEGRAPHGSFTYDYANPSRRLQQITGLASASFTYGADGRTLTYTHASGTTSFGYTATGLPTQVTAPGASLLNVYDADEWRIKRQVTVGTAVTTDYSLRSALGASTLSRYRKSCATGALEWTADTIYAGGRLLGAFEADLSSPVVEFVSPSSSPNENVGSVGAGVRVTTATGAALACPVTVRWETPVTPSSGTATPGADYTPVTAGMMTFPAGAASGTVIGAFVPVVNDTLDEPTETFVVRLTGATSAVLGAVTSHVVSILDDDPPVAVKVLATSANESAGTVRVYVQLSGVSGYTVTATVTTTPGEAVATHDYVHTSAVLTFDPGTVERFFDVPLVNDAYAEPNEKFSFVLSGLTHATAGAIGQVTIVDDDGRREAIDPTLPGDYFALAHTSTSDATYLLIYNPHPVAVTARVTYVQPSGKGVKRTYALSAKQRIGLHVNADPFVIANTPHAAVVQTQDAARPLVAELSNYHGSGWPAGEATEGVRPSSTWLFAEGATGLSVNFQESFAIFNPSDEAVNVAMTFYGATGAVLLTKTVPISAGPGVTRVAVNPDLPTSEHSTRLVATGRDTGQPRGIVAERLMRWNSQIEGHRSAGVPAAQGSWAFAEGGKGSSRRTWRCGTRPRWRRRCGSRTGTRTGRSTPRTWASRLWAGWWWPRRRRYRPAGSGWRSTR